MVDTEQRILVNLALMGQEARPTCGYTLSGST